jgi:hypothetical protein
MNDAMSEAARIAGLAGLPARARRWLATDREPRGYLDRLVAEGMPAEAIEFLACALPKRQAVWWACLCVWHACRSEAGTRRLADLESAIRWVIDPCEAKRQACAQADAMAALRAPAGSLAMAVAWSGGSLAPPGLPVVPPPDYLTGRAAGNAILLAAVEREPQEYLRHYRQFLALGLEVADGKSLWVRESEPEQPVHVAEPAEEMLASVGG